MRTEIINDPTLLIPTTNLHKYKILPYDSSSSSRCTESIQSTHNTISSLVTSQYKP